MNQTQQALIDKSPLAELWGDTFDPPAVKSTTNPPMSEHGSATYLPAKPEKLPNAKTCLHCGHWSGNKLFCCTAHETKWKSNMNRWADQVVKTSIIGPDGEELF